MLATGSSGLRVHDRTFTAWYSGNKYEIYVVRQSRCSGRTVELSGWCICCNVVIPQMLWFKKVRTSPCRCSRLDGHPVGMWLERYMIIITSLDRDFLPSSWANFIATLWDNSTFLGLGRPVHLPVPSVRALPADDLDGGSARTVAVFEARRRSRQMSEPKFSA